MKIANFKHVPGEMPPRNRWLLSIEIGRCPKNTYPKGIFKPYIDIVCFKFLDGFYEQKRQLDLEGALKYRKGFFRTYVSPIGIKIEIV